MRLISKVIAFILTCTLSAAFGQKTQDILVLKNGSTIKGKIVSFDASTGSASIEIIGGSVFAYTKAEIADIKLNGDTLSNSYRNANSKNGGFKSKFNSEIVLGALFGQTNQIYYSPTTSVQFGFKSAYIINRFFETGIKASIFGAYGTNLGVSAFSTFTLDNTKRHVPYFSAGAGVTERINNNGVYYGNASESKPSFWANAEIGLRTYFSNNFGLGYSVGYNYLQFEESYIDWSGFETTTNFKVNRFSLAVSIIF